jgi:hypothetical protein
MPEIVGFPGGSEISAPPPPLDRNIDAALRFAAREAESGEVPAAMLTPAMRETLERRRVVVRASLRAAPEKRIANILASLRTMPSRDGIDLADSESEIWQDIHDLEGVPAWALEQAAAHFRRGEARECFRPSCAELRREAVRRAAPHGEELGLIERVLRARIAPPSTAIDPERRLELSERARRLAAEIAARNRDPTRPGGGPETPPATTPVDPAARAEALGEKFRREPCALSDRALATMGRTRPPRPEPSWAE